ncbi:hypothetical protein DH09_00375 (plasmid) [Bacillaceae bacterium JMAK1]|nr:hypothetical protein DH09_00375 [Bacillaceae bacterium JMAK1]
MTAVRLVFYVILAFIFSLVSIYSKTLTIIFGLPLILYGAFKLYRYAGRFPMIIAAIGTWITTLSMCNVMFEWPIHRALFSLFVLVTSGFVGVGTFFMIKKYRRDVSDVEFVIDNGIQDRGKGWFEDQDSRIQQRKSLVKEYGWRGFLIEIEQDAYNDMDGVQFKLGDKYNINKRKAEIWK